MEPIPPVFQQADLPIKGTMNTENPIKAAERIAKERFSKPIEIPRSISPLTAILSSTKK